MANKLKELLTINEAAKQIGMGHEALRKLSIETGIAIRWGGTEKHPWIKVRLEDVERVVFNRRVHKPGTSQSPRRFSGKLDPAVRC